LLALNGHAGSIQIPGTGRDNGNRIRGRGTSKEIIFYLRRAEFWRVQVRRNSVMYGREKLALAIGRRWSLEIETSGISLKPI
jgi:hypothetical protein